MKFIVALIFIAVSLCVFISTEGNPRNRRKRVTEIERCPENLSDEQCDEYAANKLIESRSCRHPSRNGRILSWAYCLPFMCQNGTELNPEYSSEPYPKCCCRKRQFVILEN